MTPQRALGLVVTVGSVTLAAPAYGELDVFLENLGDLGAGVPTWRVSVECPFSGGGANCHLAAVMGDPEYAPIRFQSLDGDPLRNSGGPFAGLVLEDFPSAGADAWDSWVSLDFDSPGGMDVQFSPGFLGGDGTSSVIHGTSFSQADDGGWFDSNPGNPDIGYDPLIAQFTVANFEFEATIVYQLPSGEFASQAIFVSTLPAPGGAMLLFAAGTSRRRRRR